MTVSVLEAQVEHYADVRRRLFFGPTPPDVPKARRVAVRPQPHRPDLPAPKLPTIVKDRDFILVASDGFTRRDSIDLIMRQVSEKHGVASKDLIGPSRVRQVVHARYEAMYRVRHELVLSFERVGQFFGGRDHTTVLYGVRDHARRNGLTP